MGCREVTETTAGLDIATGNQRFHAKFTYIGGIGVSGIKTFLFPCALAICRHSSGLHVLI